MPEPEVEKTEACRETDGEGRRRTEAWVELTEGDIRVRGNEREDRYVR